MNLLLRLLVGGVLVFAGWSKAISPSAEFAASIEAYRLLPHAWVSLVAVGLPYIEMWVGLFLATGLFIRLAAGAAAALFTVFLAALFSTFARGIDLASCGCFGVEKFPPHVTISLDVVLLILSLWLGRRSKTPAPYSLDTWLEKSK